MPHKIAIITGCGKRRIGFHIAEALARQGYSIAVHFHTSQTDANATVTHLQQLGVEAVALPADLSDEQAVKTLVENTLEKFGRIDALVNCAAIWERKRFESIMAVDVRRHFEINTLGTFLCCQQVGLAMVSQPEGGCIVNFGDWAEVRPYLDYAAYFPSKGAVTTMTRSLAVELASRNPRVRVNCILPGPVMLPPDLPAAERAAAIAGTLLKREGSPDHVAKAVLHFLDNDFVTGVCLPVDGGRSLQSS